MQGESATWYDGIVALIGAAFFWLTGESGRVIIASGLGGLVRWFAMEKRHIRTGVIAIIGGAICGNYLWPVAMMAPHWFGLGTVERTPENIAMAGFLVGTLGVSLVKIFTAIIEARGAKLVREEGSDA